MKIKTAAILLACLLSAGVCFAWEEIDYKKFKLDDASCHVGAYYNRTAGGITLGVSAIATGKGSEFRKWEVSAIKLNIGGERYAPDEESKFYVSEESFFRVPGAIIFGVIGACANYSNNDFENAIGKVGVGLGLTLIALQAKGEITGLRAFFKLTPEVADKIEEGRDFIYVVIKNDNLHISNEIKIAILKPSGEGIARFNFDNMSAPELLGRVDKIKKDISGLEMEQSNYKYGQDPEYDLIQRKIEKLEAERGIAYKTWVEKKQ